MEGTADDEVLGWNLNGMSETWAITSYFNPMKYENRLINYRKFHERLGCSLVTAQLSSNGDFDLAKGDADILINVPDQGDRSVMFQKERLLNIALAALPSEAKYVAWLDCDVIMRPGWIKEIERVLSFRTVCQPFSSFVYLAPGQDPEDGLFTDHDGWRSTAYNRFLPKDQQIKHTQHGLAWAGRRSALDAAGFYEGMVLGGGDGAMVAAIYGDQETYARGYQMGPAWRAHYLTWATKVSIATNANVGYVKARLFHLWHGLNENRKYTNRYEGFDLANFNPSADIVGGAWAPHMQEMQDLAVNYFQSRKEDTYVNAINA